MPGIHVLEEFNRKKDVDGRDTPAMTICFREMTMPATTLRQNGTTGSMRWLKRALILGSGLILLMTAGLFVLDAVEHALVARFYKAHPMLGMMDKFRGTTPAMVDILLKRVPNGSTRADAIQILASEGMSCESVDTASRKLLACEAKNRRPQSLIPRWYVEILFDEGDRVLDGRVIAFKAG